MDVRSDHKNLTYFLTTKVLTRRQARWAQVLQYCNLRITYQKGSENAGADALSRRSDYAEGVKPFEAQLFEQQTDGSLKYKRPYEIASLWTVSTTVDKELVDSYANDTMAQELKERANTEPEVHTTPDGYIRFHGKIYVTPPHQQRIIEDTHGKTTTGHPGVKKTWDNLKDKYYFPEMKQKIQKFIENCPDYI